MVLKSNSLSRSPFLRWPEEVKTVVFGHHSFRPTRLNSSPIDQPWLIHVVSLISSEPVKLPLFLFPIFPPSITRISSGTCQTPWKLLPKTETMRAILVAFYGLISLHASAALAIEPRGSVAGLPLTPKRARLYCLVPDKCVDCRIIDDVHPRDPDWARPRAHQSYWKGLGVTPPINDKSTCVKGDGTEDGEPGENDSLALKLCISFLSGALLELIRGNIGS